MSFQQKKKKAGLKQSDGRLCWLHTTSHCRERDGDGSAEVSVCAVAAVCFVGVSDEEVKGRDLSKIKVTCACWWWFPHWSALAIYRTSGSHALKTRSACIKLFLGLVGVTLVHCAAYLKEQARGVRCCAVCWLSCGKPPHDGSIVTSFTV